MRASLAFLLAALSTASASSAPPPRIAVAVAPMHSDSAVARYPRLTAFPDSVIRAKVNALFAKAEAEDRKDRDDCLAQARASHAAGPGTYEVRIDVGYVTPRYLSMQVRRSYDCGGPYPNNGVPEPRTIDLSTAKDVNWQTIFKPGFFGGSGGGQNDGQLAALYRKRYPSVHGADKDCRAVVDEQPLSFVLRLDSKEGLMAEPDFPHAVQACADEMAFSPREIAPFVHDARFLADLNATVHPQGHP